MNFPPQLKAAVRSLPYPLVFATVRGAHLYGFPSPDSDYDVRGVYVLGARDVAGLTVGPETLETAETRDGIELDVVTHDAKKFFSLLLKKSGYALEQLYSPLVVHTTLEHAELKHIARGCITRHLSDHYLGFSETQWHLFRKKSPMRIKPLLYIYRVLLTGICLMQTGRIAANLRALNERFRLPHIDELIARKISGLEKGAIGDASLAFHESEYGRLRRELESASKKSNLPEEASAKPALHDLLLRLRLGI